MPDAEDIVATMRAFMALIPERKPAELFVGSAILGWLKTQPSAPVVPAYGPPPLWGLPIRLDTEMGSGAWELREGGEVVKSGRIGNLGDRVWFVPGCGFIAANYPSEWDHEFPDHARTTGGTEETR
jgi:hypothetical protein